MNKFRVLRLLSLAGIAPLLSLPVFAQDSYFYGGVGVGKSRSNIDAQGIAEREAGPGLTVGGVSRDNADGSYKVFLGYQFNRYVGAELGYFRLGTFSFNAPTTPAGTIQGQTKVQGGNLDLVGTLPITDNFSALGRIGAQAARTRGTYTGSGAAVLLNDTPSDRQINAKVGIGLQYAFSRHFMMRAEVERYRISDAVGSHPNINVYSVSLVVPFGRADDAPKMAMAEPAYVAPPPPMVAEAAPAPTPEPVVVVVPEPAPAPIAVRSVSYDAASMFAFDASALRPKGMAALDVFAQQLQGAKYQTIEVNGYTDRLGTSEYNQKLSQERADAVKAYLVSKGNIDPASITAVGHGESNPVTATADCQGKAQTAKLIDCLRPDRRVEIAVTGTR